ncbi:MAG: TonB-dependent receptor [Sulfuritalea sp.]|jgi:iron complex outermembrane receptor protein|nr:TonB-dependent receptor [Sulfuritalea sp.]
MNAGTTTKFFLKPLALLLGVAPLAVFGQETKFTPVVVTAPRAESDAASVLDATDLAARRPATSDTAALLRDIPGISLYGAGGVSSLPAIHGLADDRLRIKVDGMDLIASCPNHMNSPLSYIDPTRVGSVRVWAGIAPVSVGGDSIGGTIVVDAPPPEFAAAGAGPLFKGEFGAFYRSNANARGGNLAATYATDSLNVTYAVATAKADDYKAGGDFKTVTATGRPGESLARDVVGSTAYDTRNHTLSIALKGGKHLVEARFGYQDIPYELYPNQRMDMLGNTAHRFNLRYLGQLDWGTLEARAYTEKVDHYMDFGKDKQFVYGGPPPAIVAPGMPMYTEGKTEGAFVKADIELTQQDLLRVGGDYQTYRLNDWWPPSPSSLAGMQNPLGTPATTGGMAPNTFWNINGGKRDRLGFFAEWEAKWHSQWQTLLGVRAEQVKMDTGAVQGYNVPMYGAVAARFNALDRKRTDNNLDLTALARNTPDANRTYEFGYAQKTRSPNLYERYSWSLNAMALEMNNFVGDGNGYLGNPDLKPEVAHSLSFTGDWHSADHAAEFKVTPFYTRASNYIDVVQWNRTTNLAAAPLLTRQFVVLKYMNQAARLYGVDISGRMPLGKTGYGDWGLKGLLNYTNGRNLDTGDDLFNIMPLNAKLTLTHKFGGWDNAIEVVGVEAKDKLADARNEIRTAGYGLVNLRASYSWQQARIDFGVENLFDKLYYLPLGGAYTGQGSTMTLNTATMPWGVAVAGPGRSLYAGVSFKF